MSIFQNIALDPSDVYIADALIRNSPVLTQYEQALNVDGYSNTNSIFVPTIVHVITNSQTELTVPAYEVFNIINNINTKLLGSGVTLVPVTENNAGAPLANAGVNPINGSNISETVRIPGQGDVTYNYVTDFVAIFRNSPVNNSSTPGVSIEVLKTYVQQLTPFPSDEFFNIYLVNNLVGLNSFGNADTSVIVPTAAMNPIVSLMQENDDIFGPVISMWSIPSGPNASVAITDYRNINLPESKLPTEEYIKAVFQSFGLLNRSQPSVTTTSDSFSFISDTCVLSDCKFLSANGGDCCSDTASVAFSQGYSDLGMVSSNICDNNNLTMLSNVMDYYTPIGSTVTMQQLTRIKANFSILINDSPFLLSSLYANTHPNPDLVFLDTIDCASLGDTVTINDLPINWQEYLLSENSRILRNYPDIYTSVNTFYDYYNLIHIYNS